MQDSIHSDIKFLKGVGPFRANLFKKLGVHTISDLLEFFPRTYIYRRNSVPISALRNGENVGIIVKIKRIETQATKAGQTIFNVTVTDGTDNLICTWFLSGKRIVESLKIGDTIWINGIIGEYLHQLQIVHPDIESLENEYLEFWKDREIIPVYNLTKGLSQRVVRSVIVNAFRQYHKNINETLPEKILKDFNFNSRYIGVQKIHFPVNSTKIELEKKRFIFEEFFYLQLMFARAKGLRASSSNCINFEIKKTITTILKEHLPFELTNSQKKVVREIFSDMSSGSRMSRLLQGDVGSGKTIVTLFSLLLAVENEYQAVLMVPTELLADQHFKTITNLLTNQPQVRVSIIKGGNYKGKKQLKSDIENGEVDILIGTSAIIQ